MSDLGNPLFHVRAIHQHASRSHQIYGRNLEPHESLVREIRSLLDQAPVYLAAPVAQGRLPSLVDKCRQVLTTRENERATSEYFMKNISESCLARLKDQNDLNILFYWI